MSDHRIVGMTVFRTALAVKAVHSHGIGDIGGDVNNVILRLETDSGIVGWGDAATWPAFTGSVENSAAALHVHLRPLIMGADPFRIGSLVDGAERALVYCTEAKAAMEMALFDIVGKALGVPACDLLGGRVRDEIPLSFSIANPDFEEDLELLQVLLADGMRIFKVKTGFADHAVDLDRLERLREVLPPDADLRIDYNQGMQPFDAIQKLRDVEAFKPTFIEQPTPRDKVDALAAITRALDTPIMADESAFSPTEALRVVELRAADLISVKIMKNGGMIRAREVDAIAKAAGIACYGGDMMETGIACAAGTQLIAATTNISLGCEFYQPTYYLEDDLLAEPFPVKNGKVIVPTASGLGVAVDEDKVKKYAVETYT